MEARPSVPPRRSSQDDSDRYAVTSLTGFAITPATMYRCPTNPTTEWYVIDTAWCCRVIESFSGSWAEGNAHLFARKLNADERAWEAGLELSDGAT
jgi:hypothetical protein